MIVSASKFCDSIGYYLNCVVKDGKLTDFHFTQQRQYELSQNTILEEVCKYLGGEEVDLTKIPVRLEGTPFQKAVWTALMEIPKGELRTYSDIAKRIGKPKAVRAVGNAVGANRISIVVPCHRVVGKNGMGGYSAVGGLETKRRILAVELENI